MAGTFPQTVFVSGRNLGDSFATYGPFEDGNNRYVACINEAGAPTIAIFKSTDFGLTWNEMNAVNESLISLLFFGSFSVCRDSNPGVRKLYAVFVSNVGNNLRLATFDMSTDTWTGTVISALTFISGTASMGLSIAHRNSDNQVLVVVQATDSGAPNFLARCVFAFCNLGGGVWSGAYTNIGGVSGAQKSKWSPAGILLGDNSTQHVFFFQLDQAGAETSSIQQQALHSDNTLGALQSVAIIGAAGLAPPGVPDTPLSIPGVSIVVGGHQQISIAFVTIADRVNIKVLTGMSADSIAFSTRTINTAGTIPAVLALALASNATSLLCYWFGLTGGITNTVFFASSGGGAFGSSTLLGTYAGTILASVGLNSVAATGLATGGAWALAFPGTLFYFEPAVPAPAPALSPIGPGRGASPPASKLAGVAKGMGPGWAFGLSPAMLASSQFYRNGFDMCLARDWVEINRRDPYAFSCPKPAQCYPSEPPWIIMPKEGRKFKPVGTLAVAGNFTGLDVVVVQLKVDKGYDGVITDIVAALSSIGGTGFAEGSGDVVFRLQQNLRWSRDLGNVQVTLGSMLSPGYSGMNRLRIYSGQLITLFVNLLPAAAARINPNAVVICSLNGYMYPRT